jgi:hypothetical protein
MTLLQIQQAVYRRVKLLDSPSASDVTRITQFVNLWYRRILASPGMDRLRDTALTFTTVAGQAQYGLPQALTKIRSLYNIANQQRILPLSLEDLRTRDPGLTATSSLVERWLAVNGWSATRVVLATTGVGLWAVSDSASDTTQGLSVETIRLGGVRAGLSTSTILTGTTRVQIGTLTDHVEVVKVFLDAAAVGTVTLYDAASSGTVLAQITPGRTSARYFMIQLYPSPSAALTINVDAQRAIEDLVRPTEEPLLPEDYHHVLMHGAAYEEWQNRSDPRAKDEWAETQRILSDLRHALLTSPDDIPVQRGPQNQSPWTSRLGGQYPAGT